MLMISSDGRELVICDLKIEDMFGAMEQMFSERVQRIGHKILLETATREEIEEHYLSVDPLLEFVPYLPLDQAPKFHTLMAERAFANYKGGLSLLYDMAPTEGATKDYREAEATITSMRRQFGQTHDPARPYQGIDRRVLDLFSSYCVRDAVENHYLLDSQSAGGRLIGCQALRSGLQSLYGLDGNHIRANRHIEYSLAGQATDGILFATIMQLLVDKQQARAANQPTDLAALSDLLNCVKVYAGDMLSEQPPPKYAFNLACTLVASAVEGCDRTDIRNRLVKGDLHEALWMIDAHVLRASHDEYSHLRVSPSDHADDRGNLRNLSLRRGHDFSMYNQSTGKIQYVQLKSTASMRKNKQYHGDIGLFREASFHELANNPPAIIDRMRVYRQLSDSGFSAATYRELDIDSILLPTVRIAFDHMLTT